MQPLHNPSHPIRASSPLPYPSAHVRPQEPILQSNLTSIFRIPHATQLFLSAHSTSPTQPRKYSTPVTYATPHSRRLTTRLVLVHPIDESPLPIHGSIACCDQSFAGRILLVSETFYMTDPRHPSSIA
ncbi:hypothetical protein E4U43_000301 [Claviceps pusilla]|uniref:Uncharacterized protein n=1 Tax=Claviceps pusilla TaxID=123648 RepID=A0A9P7NBR8_9HYPO|nr:hypothetical protein E4U43_000301 [Claviceps pusilla]